MRRAVGIGIMVVGLVGVGLVFVVSGRANSAPALPTVAAEPSLVPSETALPSDTLMPTDTYTPSATYTQTPTVTYTPSDTPTATQTLATRVLAVNVVNPGVVLDRPTQTPMPTLTDTPFPTMDVPLPPATAVIGLASNSRDEVGWVRFEDDDVAMQYAGAWQSFATGDGVYRATEGHYKYSADVGSKVTFKFLGAAVRLRYAMSGAGGVAELRVDGKVMDTIDLYVSPAKYPLGAFESTAIYRLYHGYHTVEWINTEHRNPDSKGNVISLDAIEIYKSGPAPTTLPTRQPSATATETALPEVAHQIAVVAAPPPILPTPTPVQAGVIAVDLLIGYDANGNRVVDPDEGVDGVSVRLIDVASNKVVVSGMTDSRGLVHLETTSDRAIRLAIPLFGKYWDLPRNRGSYSVSYVYLIPAGNQPGLIP